MMVYNSSFYYLCRVIIGIKRYPYIVIAFLENLFWHIVLYFGKKCQDAGTKYNVSVCCMFKNEAKYLREWLLYHRIIGIDHFYLYNNNSDDNYQEVLQPFIDEGYVTLVEWPMPQGQIPAYEDWYSRFRRETRWGTFIDVDEFICPYDETNVSKWLEEYSKYPAVKMYWKIFGTSGNITHDDTKLVIEQYHVCWDKPWFIGKQFYNTAYDISKFKLNVHHSMNCDVRFMGKILHMPAVNEFKYFDNHYGVIFTKKHFTLQLNHYQSKSYMSYVGLMQKSDSAHQNNPRGKQHFLLQENLNVTTDYRIYRFIIQLKVKYFGIKPNIFDEKN